MSFLSLTWVAWLWITVGLYWLVPRSARPWVLMGLSLAFMLLADPLSAGLLILAYGVTVIGVRAPRLSGAMLLVLGSVLVVVLAGFKITALFEPRNFLAEVGIPLGLSYYTFRCLHVLIEQFKGNLGPVTLRDLAAYLFFLPTFVIGPIHRYRPFLRDQNRQRFDLGQIWTGGERILLGYFKIAVLSNFLVEMLMGQMIAGLAPSYPAVAAYLTVVQNGLNIYLQFAGHSDIAIGFAAAIGFAVMENFNKPYLQPNISAFWRSWHISLSQWCRDYVYTPVVAQTRNPALGALLTMLVIGLWHEISLRYVVWGAYHGVGLIVWQWFQTQIPRQAETAAVTAMSRLAHWVSVVATVHFVWFSFVILTTPNLRDVPARFLEVLGMGAGG